MTCVIILAAGASRRLGRTKQTLPYKEVSLLKHTINAAVNSDAGPVIVVTGANEEEIRGDIENEPVEIVSNKNYHEGIAASIRAGLRYTLDVYKDCEDIILMVCDQPYVDTTLLKRLVDARQTANKSIVACSYKDTIGVPALFNKKFFSELLSLKGEEGGKKILLNHVYAVASIPFPQGVIDIDTTADYEALIRENRK